MKMSEDIEIGFNTFVPLSNGFINRDRNTSNTAVIINPVPVMRPDNELPVKKSNVGVISFRNLKLHTRFVRENVSHAMVHVVLKRIADFSRNSLFLSRPAMIPCMTNEMQIRLRVLQKKLDAREDHILHSVNRISWGEKITLRSVFVNTVRDEISKQANDNRINL